MNVFVKKVTLERNAKSETPAYPTHATTTDNAQSLDQAMIALAPLGGKVYDVKSQTNATPILAKTEACVQNWSLIMNAHVHMDFEAKVAKKKERDVPLIHVLMMVGALKHHPGVLIAYANQDSLEQYVQ